MPVSSDARGIDCSTCGFVDNVINEKLHVFNQNSPASVPVT